MGRVKNPPPGPESFEQSPGRELLHGLGLLRDRLAQPRLVNARHVHLPDLLLERHPAQQVFDPPLDRLAGVAIEGRGRLLGRCGAAGQAVRHEKRQETTLARHVLLPVGSGELDPEQPGTWSGCHAHAKGEHGEPRHSLTRGSRSASLHIGALHARKTRAWHPEGPVAEPGPWSKLGSITGNVAGPARPINVHPVHPSGMSPGRPIGRRTRQALTRDRPAAL